MRRVPRKTLFSHRLIFFSVIWPASLLLIFKATEISLLNLQLQWQNRPQDLSKRPSSAPFVLPLLCVNAPSCTSLSTVLLSTNGLLNLQFTGLNIIRVGNVAELGLIVIPVCHLPLFYSLQVWSVLFSSLVLSWILYFSAFLFSVQLRKSCRP